VAVLDDLGVDQAHVMGFSMGGMIVQLLAIDHADRLLSITSVMSTTGDPDVGNPAPEAQELILAPPPANREQFIQRQFESVRTWGSPAGYDEDRLRSVHGEAYDRCFHPVGQTRQLLAIMASSSRTAALESVRVPALVIHGDADRLVDPSGGRRTAEAIPGARFELIEGMGHDYPPMFWGRIVELVVDHALAHS
jgi:pimeloyl-ACP methyl ester carboxylesterase